MCGIVGLWRPGASFDPSSAERSLTDAASSISHRGPDAGAVRVLAEHGLGFGHRRLSILDLDPRADQPMASADKTVLVTYNGEIYNFRALREELFRAGASFKTESDTEVLIEGYRAWGLEGVLSRACGMFAFALYDLKERILYLARDRAGKKPLFYAEQDGGLYFASELRALKRLLPRTFELDPAGLDAYLSLKFVPREGTLLKGVRKVPAGAILSKTGGQAAETEDYWHPYRRRLAPPPSPENALERLDAAFETAVKRRLVSDVPVCLFLSGGVDSSLIAAYLSRAGAREMTAYTIGYKDMPAYNEFEYARLAARRFGLRHEEVAMEERQVLALLQDGAGGADEPISDWVWLPLDHLSRRAREDRFKVVLVGEGSDELFFGYDVMLKGLKDLRRFESPAWRAAARAGAAVLAPVYKVSRRGHRRYDLLRRAGSGEPVYLGSSVGFNRSQRHQVAGPRLLGAGAPEAGAAFVRSLEERFASTAPDPEDAANLVCYIEFHSKMSEVLLQRVDRITMLHSLEARSPFLDHELAELAFSIPGDWKIKNGLKSFLKELAARSLPPEILERRKMGFSFPFKEWLRGGLGGTVEAAFKDSRLIKEGWINGDYCAGMLREHRGGRDHAPRLWMLYDLCRWYDRWAA